MDAIAKTQTPVTSAEVQEVRFPLIRRGGYDPKQVDPFLEAIAKRLTPGAVPDPNVNAQFVHQTRFNTVRRGGYAPASVDAFLDRVIDTLDPPSPSAPTTPHQEATPRSVSAEDAEVAWSAAPTAPDPLDQGRANLERLRVLYDAGLLSDKELAVLARRVKRVAREQHEGAGSVA